MANYYQNPYLNNQMYPYFNNMQYQQPIQQQQPTIQQGGFIPVNSEKEAADYLVAQGTSVTFIDGNNKRMYVKTRGFSPVEQPSFKRYELVELTDGEITQEAKQESSFKEYAEKSEIKVLRGKIEHLESEIKKIREEKTDE